jgi:hypothetical protein
MDENIQSTQAPDPEPVPQLPPSPSPIATEAGPAPAYLSPAPQTNLWAVISLVSSILAWCGLFGIGGIIGIIAGVIARNEIAASRGAQTGDGIALAGIILGAVNVFGACIALVCIAFALGLPLIFWPFTAFGR